MKNYSRQREAILTTLRSTDTHPTANWIYAKVREVIPNISLGTVYRNLLNLSESGDILCIDVGDGFVHYDGNVLPHLHFYCKSCKTITDVVLQDDIIAKKAEEFGFKAENSIYVVNGICKNCN